MTREQAIRLLERTSIMVLGCKPTIYEEALGTVIEELERSTWIPCSERLPDDGICVLVTVSGQHNNITFVDALQIGLFSGDEGWIIDGFLDWTTPDVTAWQPLPEPYKEVSGND